MDINRSYLKLHLRSGSRYWPNSRSRSSSKSQNRDQD